MNSRLTVAEVRAQTYHVVTPSDANDASFLAKLNDVTERMINHGVWPGVKGIVEFNATTGYITLPRRYETILGCVVNNWPRAVYGRYHEFLPGGPGFEKDLDYDYGLLSDQEDVCTEGVQAAAGLIRLTIANATDANKTVRVYGVDANGDTIFDSTGKEGIAMTLANPTVTGSVSMFVKAVSKAVTVGNVTISSVTDGTATELSVYEPTETDPLYRRYKLGTITARDDETPAVRTLCKRRWIKLVNETDLVYPGNLGALKMGLLAAMVEETGGKQLREAEDYWTKCWQLLNSQIAHKRGAIRPIIPFDPGCGRMQTVR